MPAKNKSGRKFIEVSPPVETTNVSDIPQANRLEPVEGVIVLIDASGMKGIWNREDPFTVLKRWQEAKNNIFVAVRGLGTDLEFHGYDQRKLKFDAFSDTIIISSPITSGGVGNKGPKPFWQAIMLTGRMLMGLYRNSVSDDFFFRGCVSTGEFFRSKDMIIGPAIDEAAEYYGLPEWSGISCAPSASKKLTHAKEMGVSLENSFIQYDIPLKGGLEKNGWALNWPLHPHVTEKYVRHILYEKVRSTKGISEYFKFKNTLAFFDFVTASKYS